MSIDVKIEGVSIAARQIAESSITIRDTFQKNSTLSIGLYYKAVEGIPEEGRDIEVYDGATKLFGGTIKNLSATPITPSQTTSADLKLSTTSDGYGGIPIRRTVNTLYTDTTAGAAVASLISGILSEEGVTAGTIDTGATIDSYSAIYKSVKEILDDMADASGYTWFIDMNKALNFKSQATPTISSKTLDTDDGDHFDFRPNRSTDRFRNKQFVEGGTNSIGEIIRVVVEDSADIAARALAEGGSGVHGNIYRDNTIQTEDDALAVATELLNRYKKPISAKFSSYALNTEFNVGEIIEVNYPKYNILSGSEFLVTTKTMTREKHRWVYTYDIEARDTAAYSGKAKSNAVDFFSKLAKSNLIKSGPIPSGGLTGQVLRKVSNLDGDATWQTIATLSTTISDITYYVRPDGSDSNNGLSNTSSGAFLTISHALSMIPDIVNHIIEINIADGTYDDYIFIKGKIGSGLVRLTGNTTTPANCSIGYMYMNQNQIKVYVNGLNFTKADKTNLEMYTCAFVGVQKCRFVVASSGNTYGVFASSNTYCLVLECVISNRYVALWSQQGTMFSSENTGTGNTYVLYCDSAGTLGKNGTQPTGTYAQTATWGGEIR